MPRTKRALAWPGAFLLAAGTLGCNPAPVGWKPILEQTSTASLRTEAQQALEHLRKARDLLTSVPTDAQMELAGAEQALERLLVYYLPLVDARERAYNAYRHFYLGEKERAASELEQTEKILVEMAGAGEHLAFALERPLGELAAARAELAGGSEKASARLAELAITLNGLVVKGELVLNSGT